MKDETKHPCLVCTDYKSCPLTENEKESFEYWQIHWCPQQVFWLLKYADIIHEGRWPVADTTALGGMSGKVPTEAAFTKAALLIAELDYRLAKTGWRGRLLAEECKNRERMEYLSDDAKDALYYVAGWNRRRMEFDDWRKKRRYRVHQKVVMDAA